MRERLVPLFLLTVIFGTVLAIRVQRLTPTLVLAQTNKSRSAATRPSAAPTAPPLNVTVQAATDKNELKAQQDLVVATRRLVKATWFLVAVGLLQGLVFLGTLWVIKRQGDITQTQLRPWIAVENIWLEYPHDFPAILPMFLPRNEGRPLLPFLKIRTTNTGETVGMRVTIPPASAVTIDVQIPEPPTSGSDLKKFNEDVNRINRANDLARTTALERAKNEFCKLYGALPEAPGGWMMFPKQSRSDAMVAFGDFGEPSAKSGTFEIYLVGSVNYESPLARGGFCQTGFVFQLVKRSSEGKTERTFTRIPTRADSVEFEPAWYCTWAK